MDCWIMKKSEVYMACGDKKRYYYTINFSADNDSRLLFFF